MAPTQDFKNTTIQCLIHHQLLMLNCQYKDFVVRLRELNVEIRAMNQLYQDAVAGGVDVDLADIMLKLAELTQERSEIARREKGFKRAIAADEELLGRVVKASGSDTEMGSD